MVFCGISSEIPAKRTLGEPPHTAAFTYYHSQVQSYAPDGAVYYCLPL